MEEEALLADSAECMSAPCRPSATSCLVCTALQLLPRKPPSSKRAARQYWCCGITNIILPGVGAITLGIIERRRQYFLIGLLQLLLAVLIIGWLWAVAFGVSLILLTFSAKLKKNRKKHRSPHHVSKGSFSVPTIVTVYNPPSAGRTTPVQPRRTTGDNIAGHGNMESISTHHRVSVASDEIVIEEVQA